MSISLSAFSINTRSPYPVRTENGYSFLFTTDYGHIYEIGFLEDFTLGDNCNTYQFFISLHDSNHYPRDKKVFDTIVAILEEFFKNELVVDDTQYYFSIIAKRDMPFLAERIESLNQLYTTLDAK